MTTVKSPTYMPSLPNPPSPPPTYWWVGGECSVGLWMVVLSVWALLCVTHTNQVLGHWVSPENIHNLVFGTFHLKAGYLRWVWHGYLLKSHIDRLS